jgi:hypothetical protein
VISNALPGYVGALSYVSNVDDEVATDDASGGAPDPQALHAAVEEDSFDDMRLGTLLKIQDNGIRLPNGLR